MSCYNASVLKELHSMIKTQYKTLNQDLFDLIFKHSDNNLTISLVCFFEIDKNNCYNMLCYESALACSCHLF